MAADNIQSITPITLPVSNMYADGKMVVFADGTGKLKRTRVVYEPTEPDEYHTVKIGERITQIAYNRYKDKVPNPNHWYWVICDANSIRNPLDLSAFVGKTIVIPNILNFKLKK